MLGVVRGSQWGIRGVGVSGVYWGQAGSVVLRGQRGIGSIGGIGAPWGCSRCWGLLGALSGASGV